jgi:hypothetical protein
MCRGVRRIAIRDRHDPSLNHTNGAARSCTHVSCYYYLELSLMLRLLLLLLLLNAPKRPVARHLKIPHTDLANMSAVSEDLREVACPACFLLLAVPCTTSSCSSEL